MKSRSRITLTKAESETPEGGQMVHRILAMCHDGELTISEVEDLHIFLRSCKAPIAALSFLRSITRDIVADGRVDEVEAYRLKQAMERVVPKSVRGVVSTHLGRIGLPVDQDEEQPVWRQSRATPKQIEYIAILGGQPRVDMLKGEACDLIDALLERRPPSARQQMLLRFFDRLDLMTSTKEQVSEWIDVHYDSDSRFERAWERFKRETNHDPHELDPHVVPIGAYRKYMNSQPAGQGLLVRVISWLSR